LANCPAASGLVGEDIAARAIELHDRDKQTRYRNQPTYARPLGPGNLEAVANPVTVGAPQS
jgi:hypothetical protein